MSGAAALSALAADLYDAGSQREPAYAFSREEYARRQVRLREEMERAGVDFSLFSAPETICYLHGYASRWNKAYSTTRWPPLQCTALHVSEPEPIVFEVTSHHEMLRRGSVATDLRLCPREDSAAMLAFIIDELADAGWLQAPGGRPGLTVGQEKWSPVPNPAVSAMVEQALRAHGADVVDVSALVRKVQRLKSAAEIQAIETAARIADAGIEQLRRQLVPGMTELEASATLALGMAQAGGEPPALHPLVTTGYYHGHQFATRRGIRMGELVGVDPCGVYNRYHANVEVTMCIGEPSPGLLRIAEIQSEACDIVVNECGPGVPVNEVNTRLREHYRRHGLWDARQWIGGYELGLSFAPDWVGEWIFDAEDIDAEGCFEAGMVTNFEASAPLAMNDTMVIDATGARMLSTHPHTILVAGE